MDVPYTKQRHAQFRGPSTSDDYNARIEENFRDLVVLYNRGRVTEMDLAEFYRRMAKDQLELTRVLDELESRVATLEDGATRLTFHSADHIDNDLFNGSAYEIQPIGRAYHDVQHGMLTLPLVETSSLSRLYLTNSQSEDVLPPSLETRVVPDPASVDSGTAIIDTSEPELAVIRRPGRIWERNVAALATAPAGAKLALYLKVPTDLYTTDKSNTLVLHPYPAFAVDITDISYTTSVDVMSDDSDGYLPLNGNVDHTDEAMSVGWVAPRTGGAVVAGAGPRVFRFDPKAVTGFRIRMETTRYLQETGRFVYTYGLSRLDLRYDKFLATGKVMIRVEPSAGGTISAITDVQPQIWNMDQSIWGAVFSYRVIYPTVTPGQYTLSSSGGNFPQAWVEVTLTESPGRGTPALSGIVVEYD